MSLLNFLWETLVNPPGPKPPALVPTDRFKLVHFDASKDGGWEAHQWYSDPDGDGGEWRKLHLCCGGLGVYWEDTRSRDRADAEYAVKKERERLHAEQRPTVVTEYPV